MMKLFLVACLIAFTAALKDVPRRRKLTSQSTRRGLDHGKNGSSKKGSKNGYAGVVTTDESDTAESTYAPDSTLGGVESGVVSTNADNSVVESPTDPTSPTEATPTGDLSQTSTSTDPTSPTEATPTEDLSQTSSSTGVTIDDSLLDPSEESSDEFSVPALAPSSVFPREINPAAFSSDAPSLVPSSVPSSAILPAEATPTAFSSDAPSLLPSLVPSSLPREATPTAFSTAIEVAGGSLGSDAPSFVPSMAPTATSLGSDAPSFVPSMAPTATSLGSDAPSFVPSMAPTAIALSSDAPSLVPSMAPTATARSSDAPSLVPSLALPGDATSATISSDAPSLVPSMTPSSATVPNAASPTALSSDKPSLVPSSMPSLNTAGEVSPTNIFDDGSTSLPSAITNDGTSPAPSATPSDFPSGVPTSSLVNPDSDQSGGYATCEQYDSPAFDDSITAEIAVQYWYQLEVKEDELNTFNVAISQLVETVEIVLLETVQATMCAGTADRRRLAKNSIAFSASPRDIPLGSCGEECYPVYGAMTVKVDQSVSQDPDARDAMYCAVLQIIHGTMGTSTLSDLTGIRSTELLDRSMDKCGLGDFGLQGSSNTRGPISGGGGGGGGGAEEGGLSLGVTMSYVVAGGIIAFTAMFMYGRRKQYRRDANSNSGSMMDMDTTIAGDGAASIDIRTGIEPQQQQASPMSAYSNSSLYTGSHADDTLLLANSGECWSDVNLDISNASELDLDSANASELGLPYEHA